MTVATTHAARQARASRSRARRWSSGSPSSTSPRFVGEQDASLSPSNAMPLSSPAPSHRGPPAVLGPAAIVDRAGRSLPTAASTPAPSLEDAGRSRRRAVRQSIEAGAARRPPGSRNATAAFTYASTASARGGRERGVHGSAARCGRQLVLLPPGSSSGPRQEDLHPVVGRRVVRRGQGHAEVAGADRGPPGDRGVGRTPPVLRPRRPAVVLREAAQELDAARTGIARDEDPRTRRESFLGEAGERAPDPPQVLRGEAPLAEALANPVRPEEGVVAHGSGQYRLRYAPR
jgi:hypothetical protein